MLKGKHHFLLDPFLRYYVIRKMNRHFHSVRIIGSVTDKKLPVLLIGNHISWWDGIWALNINQAIFHRRYYFMMLEEQLLKNWFLNFAGGYSIPIYSKGKIESINYTIELLTDPKNLVLIFPQGEIESMYKQEFTFKKGISHILQRLKNDIQLIFLVNLTDYHSHVKPVVYSFLKEYNGSIELAEIESGYTKFHSECIAQLVKIKA